MCLDTSFFYSLVTRNKHRKGNTLLWAMMDKINQITFHFFETLWCKQSVSACYSAIQLKPQSGKQ